MIEVNFEAAKEPQPAPNGRYNLMITGAEVKQSGPQSKNPGSEYISLNIGFTDEPNTPNMWHSIYLPQDGDKESARNFKTLMLKRLNHAFKIGLRSGQTTAQDIAMACHGAEAQNIEVKQSIYTQGNRTGEVFNEMVLPKVPNE